MCHVGHWSKLKSFFILGHSLDFYDVWGKTMWCPHLRLGSQWQSYQVTGPTILVIVPLTTRYECAQGLQSRYNCVLHLDKSNYVLHLDKNNCILHLDKSNCVLHLDNRSEWRAFIGKTWIAPRGFGWNGFIVDQKRNFNWLSWVFQRELW